MNSLIKSIVLVFATGVAASIGAQLLGISILSLSTLEVALAVFASAGVLLTAAADYKPRHPPYTMLTKEVLEASLRRQIRNAPAPRQPSAASRR